jgi:hypothetical protein
MYHDCLHGRHLDLCKQSKGPSKTHEIGTSMIMETQSLFETKEMRIQQNDNGIPRTYHSRRKTANGPG